KQRTIRRLEVGDGEDCSRHCHDDGCRPNCRPKLSRLSATHPAASRKNQGKPRTGDVHTVLGGQLFPLFKTGAFNHSATHPTTVLSATIEELPPGCNRRWTITVRVECLGPLAARRARPQDSTHLLDRTK